MKRLTALMCVLAMFTGICATGEEVGAELPDVVLKVKAALVIGDEYDDFNGSNYDGMWDLYWTGEDKEASVVCSGDGVVYNYYSYERDKYYDRDYSPRYPDMISDELGAIADDFLGRVLNGPGEGWIIDKIDSSLQHGSDAEARIEGRLTLLEKPTDTVISLTVDTADGSVSSYYRSDGYMDYNEFTGDVTEAITAEEAFEKLRSVNEMEIRYYTVDPGEMARLIYVPSDKGSYVVRASDGALIDMDEAYGENYRYESGAALTAMGAAEDTAGYYLTEAELEGIGVYDSALTTDELDGILRGMSELGITDEFFITDANYYLSGDELISTVNYARAIGPDEAEKRQLDTGYEYYDYKHTTVNAETGALISLYSDYPGEGADRDMDGDVLAAAADAFIEKYFAEYADRAIMKNAAPEPRYYAWNRTYGVDYVRVHNGYPYHENWISVRVNAETGCIDGFEINWNDMQEFVEAAPEELLPHVAALYAYMECFAFESAFVSMPGENFDEWEEVYERVYCWQLRDIAGCYGVDALTGEVLTHRYGDADGFEYSDIDDSQEYLAAHMLGEYGVGFDGGSFCPDAEFTLRDGLIFIVQALPYRYTDVENCDIGYLIDIAMNSGAPDLKGYAEDAQLSRGEFTRILICMSGYAKAAELSGIYECGFADAAELSDTEHASAAIAYALGLIDTDENSCINYDSGLTRLEAAEIFHKLLSLD